MFEHLKHHARYLSGIPRLVRAFPQQTRITTQKTFADSSLAGCVVTRRFTSSFARRIGRHCKSPGSYWTPTGLSWGEAEYYSSVQAACRGLGVKDLAPDLGWDLSLELGVDSSACKGLCAWRGAGSIRHIETPTLWLQQAVSRKRLKVNKVPGTKHPSVLELRLLQVLKFRNTSTV